MWRSAPRRQRDVGVLALLMLGAGATQAHAISFHFSPANITVQARPGQVVNRTFTLTLAKDTTSTHFQARVEDWWRSPDGSRTFYAAPGTIRRSCGLWCTINPVEAAVQPGETMTLRLSLRVPDDVQPGGYWAALTVDEVLDPLAPRPSGVAVVFKASVSVGILVEIPPATRSARITGVRVTGDSVAVTMCNEGNIPLRVNGTFEFYAPGQEKPAATVQIGGEPLLPEPLGTCEFSGALPSSNQLPSGHYKVRVIVDVGLDHLLGAEKELEIVRSEGS